MIKECRLDIIKEGNFLRFARGQQEECATGGVEDSGRMRGPGRRGQEDKDEEDERTRMRRTRMIFQDSISRKMYDVDRVGKMIMDEKKII